MSETTVPSTSARKRIPRPVAAAIEIPISGDEIRTLLKGSELDQSMLELIHALGLDTPDLREKPGRLAFLHEVFATRPSLLEAARSKDTSRVQREWKAYSKTQAGNPLFWHFNAMLLREKRLHCPNDWNLSQWEKLSALWIWLVSTEAFWREFRTTRFSPVQAETIAPFSDDEERELFEWALSEWLDTHHSEGAGALARGQREEATFHFRCLKLAAAEENEWQKQLEKNNLEISIPLDALKAQFARKTAAALLEEWEKAAIREADQLVPKDPNRASFENAIASLEKYAEIGGNSIAILTVILDRHIQWADAEKEWQRVEIPRLADSARRAVAKLESLATPGDALRRENNLLSTYYVYSARAESRDMQKAAAAESALKWNPGNLEAQQIFFFSQLNQQHTFEAVREFLNQCRRRGFDPELLDAAAQQLEACKKQ